MILWVDPGEMQYAILDLRARQVIEAAAGKSDKTSFDIRRPGAGHLQPPRLVGGRLMYFKIPPAIEVGIGGAGGGVGSIAVLLLARLGYEVRVVPGDPFNIKITRPDDLRMAEANFEEWSCR